MANNQSQSQNSSSKSSTSGSNSKPHSSTSSSQSSSSPSTSGSLNSSGSTNSASGSGDPIEQYIAKGVTQLLGTLEPQLNRIGTQIVNRVMSRGEKIADTGVKRMQDQPWYMVGGALALVAVGIGLLFAFDADSQSRPDFSSTNVQ